MRAMAPSESSSPKPLQKVFTSCRPCMDRSSDAGIFPRFAFLGRLSKVLILVFAARQEDPVVKHAHSPLSNAISALSKDRVLWVYIQLQGTNNIIFAVSLAVGDSRQREAGITRKTSAVISQGTLCATCSGEP